MSPVSVLPLADRLVVRPQLLDSEVPLSIEDKTTVASLDGRASPLFLHIPAHCPSNITPSVTLCDNVSNGRPEGPLPALTEEARHRFLTEMDLQVGLAPITFLAWDSASASSVAPDDNWLSSVLQIVTGICTALLLGSSESLQGIRIGIFCPWFPSCGLR